MVGIVKFDILHTYLILPSLRLWTAYRYTMETHTEKTQWIKKKKKPCSAPRAANLACCRKSERILNILFSTSYEIPD